MDPQPAAAPTVAAVAAAAKRRRRQPVNVSRSADICRPIPEENSTARNNDGDNTRTTSTDTPADSPDQSTSTPLTAAAGTRAAATVSAVQNESATTTSRPESGTSSLQQCAAQANILGRTNSQESHPTLSTQSSETLATGRHEASQPATDRDEPNPPSQPSVEAADPSDDPSDGDSDDSSTSSSGDSSGDSSANSSAESTADGSADGTQEEGEDNSGSNANDGTPPEDEPPQIEIVTEVGADLPSYILTETDKLLDSVYGDHPHQNDGSQLDGGVASNNFWYKHWKLLIQYNPTHYIVPKGAIGRRFVQQLAKEFQGVRERKWNSERPIVFAMVILQKMPGVFQSKEIRKLLQHRMDLWDQGMYVSLVDDAANMLSGPRGSPRERDEETEARAFANTVASGRLRKAVTNLCRPEGGKGVLHPDSICEKEGIPVIDVLRSKHPEMRDPGPYTEDGGAFEPYSDAGPPATIPLIVSSDLVEKVASRLGSAAAGPSGVDSVEFAHWLLHFGRESELLRDEMAAFTEWLANTIPPYAAIRGLFGNRLVPLDKNPGVRPLGIGETYRRLMGKCVLALRGPEATMVCGNYNLCAGLSAGIEGACHAMRQYWHGDEGAWEEAAAAAAASEAPGTHNESIVSVPLPEEEGPQASRTHLEEGSNGDDTSSNSTPALNAAGISRQCYSQRSTQDDLSLSGGEDDSSPDAILKIDAKNGFNELSRKAMLWTVRHRWANGSTFAFNSYRHASICVVRRPGEPAYFLQGKEGTTQGDVLSMVLYGLTLVPMAETLRRLAPSVLQPWYADDAAMAGKCEDIAPAMSHLLRIGPLRGYYPEPSKSVLICDPGEDRERAKALFADFDFQYSDGDRYLGGFIGTMESRREWLKPKIEQWVHSVEKLAKVAKRHPQAAYAAFTKSLQSQWLYSLRVVHDVGPAFQPIEDAIRSSFLPSLLGMDANAFADGSNERKLTVLPVKFAGLGIPNPAQSAKEQFETSRMITSELTDSLSHNTELAVPDYLQQGAETRNQRRAIRTGTHKGAMNEFLSASDETAKRRLKRSSQTGSWLTVTPNRLNGTLLSADEFRDNLRIRYGLDPLNLQSECDGCYQRFSVEHALSCKKGGLITIRHDDIKGEWHQLCAMALKPSAISDEPLIYSGRVVAQGTQNANAAVAPAPTAPSGVRNHHSSSAQVVPPEHRGDVAAHGFWERGTTAVFDIRVTDTEAPSYRRMDPHKVLKKHEKEKKDKYLDACLARRRQFTPLVFSVDGLRSRETDSACKRLSVLLANKWNRKYPHVCGYVRSRLSLALARATTMCLRSTRDHTSIARSIPPSMDGASLGLYR